MLVFCENDATSDIIDSAPVTVKFAVGRVQRNLTALEDILTRVAFDKYFTLWSCVVRYQMFNSEHTINTRVCIRVSHYTPCMFANHLFC